MEKKVTFASSKGSKLVGIISDEDSSKPIVIFAHGLGSSKESDKYADFQNNLSKHNISVFKFDFYGHGESEGDFSDVTITEGTDDILCAIKLLKMKGFIKIGLVGTSFGGICSIIAASKTTDLKFLGLLVPVSNPEELPDLKHHEDASRLNYRMNLDSLNNGHKVANKIKVPVYIIHAGDDEIVPVKQSIIFAKLLKNAKLEIVDNADHRMRAPKVYKRVLNLMTNFIVKNF